MGRFIIRRIIINIPLLFFVSLVVYAMILSSSIDPIAIYEDNPEITAEDLAMIEYRLGLRQPAFFNFRGSNGTVRDADMIVYNLPGTLVGLRQEQLMVLPAGTSVAIIDERGDENSRWVKILHIETRSTGRANREDLAIQIDPLDSRYFKWLFAILQGDFGRSNVESRPALEMILERFPNTLYLMIPVFIVQLLIALPVGIISAIKQYSVFDYVATALAYAGRSVPLFWFGLLLIIVFHTSLRWPEFVGGYLGGKPLFPGGGMYDVRLQRTAG